MTAAQQLKQQLLYEVEHLPEDKLAEVIHFAQFLARKQRRTHQQKPHQSSDTTQDPLLALIGSSDEEPLNVFVGGVSHGSLASNIDEELYGS